MNPPTRAHEFDPGVRARGFEVRGSSPSAHLEAGPLPNPSPVPQAPSPPAPTPPTFISTGMSQTAISTIIRPSLRIVITAPREPETTDVLLVASFALALLSLPAATPRPPLLTSLLNSLPQLPLRVRRLPIIVVRVAAALLAPCTLLAVLASLSLHACFRTSASPPGALTHTGDHLLHTTYHHHMLHARS